MKETIQILLMAFVYTIAAIWFGVWLETRVINSRLPSIVKQSWQDGCNQCLQFQKDDTERDKLQGVETQPEKIK